MEKELRPVGVVDPLRKAFEENKKNELPPEMYELITSLLKEFQYDDKKITNVCRYVLNPDLDQALSDCVPMKVFFGMCANNFEEKEDWQEEKIKALLGSGMVAGEDKVTVKKARVQSSKEYEGMMAKKIRYGKLKKHCRTLEQAMEMRRDLTQTRSANFRFGMGGPYTNQ